MWKLIILAAAAYVLYRLFSNDFLKKKKVSEDEEKKDLENKISAGEMVKDPECGTYVPVEGSLSVRDGETVYHFCSYECRESFLKKLEAGGSGLDKCGKGE